MIEPDWPAPARVRALVTTRELGDMAGEAGRGAVRAHLPSDPLWLRQVHGRDVIAVDANSQRVGDGSVSREPGRVCAVMAADCMPVLFTDDEASVVAVAHAGWRGLAAGVLEAAVEATRVRPGKVMAWLGPAIGPKAYEVGEDVRKAFPDQQISFVMNRPGHWLLDLYGVARARLAAHGVKRVYGGGYCTYSDSQRFFSYRRDRARARMAALIWLT